MNPIHNAYCNFLKSRIKLRVDFLTNYSILFPELIAEEDLSFLRCISLFDTKQEELEFILKRVTVLEENISELLKSYYLKDSNFVK